MRAQRHHQQQQRQTHRDDSKTDRDLTTSISISMRRYDALPLSLSRAISIDSDEVRVVLRDDHGDVVDDGNDGDRGGCRHRDVRLRTTTASSPSAYADVSGDDHDDRRPDGDDDDNDSDFEVSASRRERDKSHRHHHHRQNSADTDMRRRRRRDRDDDDKDDDDEDTKIEDDHDHDDEEEDGEEQPLIIHLDSLSAHNSEPIFKDIKRSD